MLSCMGYFNLIKKYTLRHHFHFVLLLLFFCLNGYRNFTNLFDLISLLPFFSIVFSCAVFFYFFLLKFLKNRQKSGLITFYFIFIFLFFGNIEDAFAKIQWLVFLSEPTYFLPFLFIVSVLICNKIVRAESLNNLPVFLNLVLLAWIGYEILMLNWHANNQISISGSEFKLNKQSVKDKIPVYWITLDEYAGDSLLLSDYEFDNISYKNQMKSIGFGDISKTKANYPLTVYSVASFLNMEYLPTSTIQNISSSYGYKYALSALRDNKLAEIFSHWGYEVRNYSFFDFKIAPAYFSNSLWGGGVRAVTARCMHIRMYKHFVAFADKNHFGWFPDYERSHNYKHIMNVLDETGKNISLYNPTFNYIHFLSPHKPYLFDSTGGKLTISSEMKDQKQFNKKAYIWSVQKLNQLMFEWSKGIIKKYKGNVVIIIMSDHGPGTKNLKGRSLDNLSLVYVPEKNYRAWYSGMSNVNQGRVLLNQVFGQKLPLLQDSVHAIGGIRYNF
jgi:hypothetical protein